MNNFNKILCLSLIALLGSTGAYAIEHADITEEVKRCAGENDNTKRLSCFDALSQSVKSTPVILAPAAVGKSSTSTVTTDTQVAEKNTAPIVLTQHEKEEAFAKSEEAASNEPEITSITLTIASLKKMLRGEWKITFTNGQVWKQKGSERLSLKAGQEVQLSKGALSAYYLQKLDSNKRIQVKRLK
ncbi:hypothetical protein KO495_09140 [Colwellia sp. D2M02]|uniref:Uncharacterized protein n=1 Tax=Colwellia asteriadis TaxID=517723 RepID=A0ABN1L4C0_9GAMM|nr:hypothetical protein [Colwellia sp. D2M02]MBU2893480.1 hypothetical protein [Colwellia sp. D2M02]